MEPSLYRPGSYRKVIGSWDSGRVTDWVAWHRAYDDPDSSLARRLDVVRRRLDQSLKTLGSRAERMLSLCAGDGRDVIPVLAEQPADRRPATVLVERDETLASMAASRAREEGLEMVKVVVGDAGDPSLFADVLPVDVLMLCGIFGNISHDDIRATINAVPALLAPGGLVVWTRGRFDDDLRPQIRRWFVEAGLREVSFDGEPEPFGVGVARRPESMATTATMPPRLFTFRY
jgi:hypothetical protein